VAALTGEEEEGSALIENRLGDDEIRWSGWPNGGGGLQGGCLCASDWGRGCAVVNFSPK
jgi:hypothetical protein